MLLNIFFTLSLTAQTTDWVFSFGGTQSDKGISIGTDSLGFIYVRGYYNTSATFGSITLTNNNPSGTNKEAFLMKMDSQNEGLFPVFKHNLIFSGYIGTLVGLILVFGGHQKSIGIETMMAGISASLLTLLYGYFLANIFEPFF